MPPSAKKITAAGLRFGWTTGTCATAAALAAYRGLLGGAAHVPQAILLTTPSGKTAEIAVKMAEALPDGGFTASVIKDAGDDPDVTHGAEIVATLHRGAAGSGIVFRGGEGVGRITRPGLPLEVGEPAINPVPRRMMRDAITALAAEINGSAPDIIITISVPDGAAIARKTWNPRLGIEGGISILGTTGVVRPFSCAAWIASIHRGIDVARAGKLAHVAGSTGAVSEAAVAARFNLPPHALLDMGDFVAGMLKYLRRHPVPRLTIAGGFGKMIKLAQGHGDLHSARSQIDFPRLGALAAKVAGMDAKKIAGANTALEILQNADDAAAHALGVAVARDALAGARGILRTDSIAVDIMITRRDGTILAEVS